MDTNYHIETHYTGLYIYAHRQAANAARGHCAANNGRPATH